MSEDLVKSLRGESEAHFKGNVRHHKTIGALMAGAADALEALKRENEKLRGDVDWLRLQREKMHRRAQKAEGKLSRMGWWFERLLERAKRRRAWWTERYASAALRNAKISTGTAYQLCHDIWRQEHSELENKHESLKRENEAMREAWPRWRAMLLDESPIPGAAITEMDAALSGHTEEPK